MSEKVDDIYRERARLVAFLAKLFPSCTYVDGSLVGTKDEDYAHVIMIYGPTGQMSWHIHEKDRDLFPHVMEIASSVSDWDGHSTEEKYRRLERLTERVLPDGMGSDVLMQGQIRARPSALAAQQRKRRKRR